MTSHELANLLLAGPNLRIILISGDCNGDGDIAKIETESPETTLHFPEIDYDAESIDFPAEDIARDPYLKNCKTKPFKYPKLPYDLYDEKNDDPCIILIADNAIGN